MSGFIVDRKTISDAAEKAQRAREARLDTPVKKRREARDPYKCTECAHSTDMHNEEGCRVIGLFTGEKCNCAKR